MRNAAARDAAGHADSGHTMLANGINAGYLLALPAMVLGPLLLFEVAVETGVLAACLRIPRRRVVDSVIAANVVSTLLGGALYVAQDYVVAASGISASIPEFVRGYRRLAVCLIAAYFLKTVLIEGVVLARRTLRTRWHSTGGRIWRGVIFANLVSYAVVGPVFYYVTRPDPPGIETSMDTAWARPTDAVVYYIDDATRHVMRIQADGSSLTTLCPHAARAFLVSDDEATVIYRLRAICARFGITRRAIRS
jgi:hypothetical protein